MKKQILFYILSVLLFITVFVNDLHRVQSGEVLIAPLIREIFIASALLILVLQLLLSQPNKQKDLIAQMQGLGLSIILLCL